MLQLRSLVASLCFCAFATPAWSAAPICYGDVDLSAVAGKRLIVFGELHGTIEGPAFVANVLCALASRGDSLLLGVEIWSSQQDSLDRYLRSGGTSADKALLFASPAWNRASDMHDGVASIGTFDLIETARGLRAAGSRIEIVAINHETGRDGQDPSDRPARHERGMAALLDNAMARFPDATAVVMVGSAHASRTRIHEPGYPPMLAYMLHRDPVNLFMAHGGGSAWNMTSAGTGPRATPARPCDPPLRPAAPIELGFAPVGFDGCYSIGSITAAPLARDAR